MPRLSWNEIRDRAIKFAKEWVDEKSEKAEAKSFWDEFFQVFGIRRRAVASFEEPVKKVSGSYDFIDLIWPGVMLAEHKSAGKDLGRAHAQGMRYVRELHESGRADDEPRYIIVSDFARMALHDLEPEPDSEPSVEFPLGRLHEHVHRFGFLSGYDTRPIKPEDEANEKATRLICDLYDAMREEGYGSGHHLKQQIVRLLFCFFADDTGIFPAEAFKLYIRDRTKKDGSDVGPLLAQFFQVLNTPEEKRSTKLDEDLAQFPYVNGDLFAENLPIPSFDSEMRQKLLDCAGFRWSKISPAVFGSLFQAVMDDRERRQIGAHYTSEANILKVVRPLFLDDLRAELDAALADRSSRRKSRLIDLHNKLAKIRLLDPACGCGNFLVIAYRELRLLELDLLVALHGKQQAFSMDDVNKLSKIDVDQMFGIEIEEFPARIAEVALWLVDHQMNIRLSEAFSQFYIRIPLRKSPSIAVGNALRMDWAKVLKPGDCSYVLGNPPFVGHQYRTKDQQEDMALVWGRDGRVGRLDYVTAWYRKAADYIEGTSIRCAFVSTNSIAQGEQVGILWAPLLERKIQIDFAHRTFAWESESRGKAHVDVVIIGFSLVGRPDRRLFDHDADPSGKNPTEALCANINPYLVCGDTVLLPSRTDSPPGMPTMIKGSQPTDGSREAQKEGRGGNLLVTDEERKELLKQDPGLAPYLRRYVGGDELISGKSRWCFWLKDADPSDLKKHPEIVTRLARVKAWRKKSPTASVRDWADRPALFTQDRQPSDPFLGLSEVSSENRRYLPVGFFQPDIVPANTVQVVVGADLFHFGVISSSMHMAWVRAVAGRLESRLRYTPSVYNNFPWPAAITPARKSAVVLAAKAVLAARAKYSRSSLDALYDPLTMPADLLKAHAKLDREVEKCYRAAPFPTDRSRVEHLFDLYVKRTAPLLTQPKAAKMKQAKQVKPMRLAAKRSSAKK